MFKITAQQANELARELRDPRGRYEVGQTMMEPFREGRDYVALGRKVFGVDYVEPGAPMWYDKDPQFSAVTISELGGVPKEEIYGERVELTAFPIAVLVRIPAIEVAVRRFRILDREQVRARAEMAEREDTEVLSALATGATAAITAGNTAAVTGTSGVTRTVLANLYSQIEQNDAPVENVIFHAANYRDIRKWTGTDFDPVTRRELLKTGYMGDLWGASLRITKKQTSGTVYACAGPEFLGVISVRIDLDQMDAPMGELLQFGWVFYEYIGIAVLTTVGVARLTVTGEYS